MNVTLAIIVLAILVSGLCVGMVKLYAEIIELYARLDAQRGIIRTLNDNIFEMRFKQNNERSV